jgi:peptidoglycan/LPS O-acetylase OafA/YrhL
VGVDVFFVISGFLITSIIIDSLELDRFSFLEFYSRRARRILPALLLVVLIAIPGAWIVMLPEDFKQFAESVGAVGAFASNILFWMKSGYFAAGAENDPLLHTWSLAVEEQFYIGFPLLMLAIWRVRREAVILILSAILVASFALCEWASHGHPDANFYLTPMRAWELMIGCLAAVAVHQAGLRVNAALGWVGLLMILVPIFVYNSQTPFPSLYALLPTVGTALVLVCVDNSTSIGGTIPFNPRFRHDRRDQLQCLSLASTNVRSCADIISRRTRHRGDAVACGDYYLSRICELAFCGATIP